MIKQSGFYGTNPAYIRVNGPREAGELIKKLFDNDKIDSFGVVYSRQFGWRVYHYRVVTKTDQFWENVILAGEETGNKPPWWRFGL